MSDGKIEVEVKGGKVSEFTLAAVYFQLEDLECLLCDQAMSQVARLAQGVVAVRAMKADVRKRVAEAIVVEAKGTIMAIPAELESGVPS